MVEDLAKSYDGRRAVDGVGFTVEAGEVLCLLGHNGAGKSTTVRILACLEPRTAGRAEICGMDTATRSMEVRRRTALAGQESALDELLTGRRNLVLIARLRGLGSAAAQERAAELLARFDLTSAADRPVGDYSGGMRRRLDLAACLVTRPDVVFLDEPSTGLDPTSRREVWDAVRALAAEGTAVLLTTQYLEEAEYLADSIVVLARGRVVARGTGPELKAVVGRARVVADCPDGACADAVARIMRADGTGVVTRDRGRHRVLLDAPDGHAALRRVSASVQVRGVPVTGLALESPSLEDVYEHFAVQV